VHTLMSVIPNIILPSSMRSKVWVWRCSLAGIVGLNPAGGMDVCLFCVLCVVK
jgi:hypothetical protein